MSIRRLVMAMALISIGLIVKITIKLGPYYLLSEARHHLPNCTYMIQKMKLLIGLGALEVNKIKVVLIEK